MSDGVQGDRLRELKCNCHQWGNASRCPIHTQADFDSQERTRQGSTWLYKEVGGFSEALLSVPPGYDAPTSISLPGPVADLVMSIPFERVKEVQE